MRVSIILVVFTLILILAPATAGVSVQYTAYPEILLPGDFADCTITLTNTGSTDVKINTIIIKGNYEIKPRRFFNIGTIPSGGSYTLRFSVKIDDVGRHNLEVEVAGENQTLVQNILLIVEDKFPELTIDGPVYINEVNNIKFIVSSPIELRDFRIEFLFDSIPKVAYLGTVSGKAEGYVKFYAERVEPLKVKLIFYNGRNYHEVLREINPIYLRSKGVILNFSIETSSVYIGDCIKASLGISNLRKDDIYNISASVSSSLGSITSDHEKLAKVPSGESAEINFLYSPNKMGNDTLCLKLVYMDEFGNLYSDSECTQLNVLGAYSVSLTNVETSWQGGKLRISGDVSNNGRSEVYNVYARARSLETKEYFIGNIDPSDFQSFDLSVKSNGSIELTVRWSNKLGEQFELLKYIRAEKKAIEKSDSSPLIISSVVAIIVGIIVTYAIYRAKR